MQCICNVRLIYNISQRPLEIEGVIRDITQLKKTTQDLQKAKEIAEKSLRVKEEFLANMSHEIRTPMNGIVSMIDMLAETSLDEEQQDYVDTVRSSSETLLSILNDILDLSKIEAGKMKLRPTVVSLSSVLEKVHALFLQQANSRQIELSYQLARDLPEYVKLDETRFLQVLSNLTANAIKFTPQQGQVSILVNEADKPRPKKPDEIVLQILVKDNGIGIAPEAQKHLFEKFNQVDDSITKKYAGTGLGLSISKRLVQMMGGSIGVQSRVGEGSEFWFTCRVKLASRPTSNPRTHTDARALLEQKRAWVLLVDDNPVNRKVSGQILKKAHCQVTMAESGQKAVELVQAQRFDVILMDIQMPEMDGVAATQAIRALDLPDLPPIVAMTAYSMQGDKEKFIKAGMDDYVSKPIRPAQLINKLAEVLRIPHTHSNHQPRSERGSEEEVINFAVLRELEKYGGPEIIVDALSDFQQEAEQLIISCAESLSTSDYDNILAKLHTLKGNASTLGIERLARLVQQVEADLKQGRASLLEQQLDTLQQYFSEFQQAFNSFLKTNNHGKH